jgi:hypothetical protein
MKPDRTTILLLVGLAGSALTAFQLQRELSIWAAMLAEDWYELDLPTWLGFVLTYPQVAWALPLLVLLTWAVWPSRRQRGTAACVLAAVMLALALMAHLPFFKLAVTL